MDNSWPNEVYSLISNESIRQMSKKQRTDQPGNRHGKIVIHCFKGGHNSPQELAVIEAISIFIKDNLVIFEVMTCDDVKTKRFFLYFSSSIFLRRSSGSQLPAIVN